MITSSFPTLAQDSVTIYGREDFDDCVTYAEPSSLTVTAKKGLCYVCEEYMCEKNEYDKYLRMYHESGSVTAEKSISLATSSEVVSTVQVLVRDFNTEKRIFVQKDRQGIINNYVVIGTDGYLKNGENRDLLKIKPDMWYNIAVIQNNNHKKYSVIVNGETLCADVYFTSTDFSKPASYSIVSEEGKSEMWIDDIRVYSGDEIMDTSYFSPVPYNKAKDEEPVIESEILAEDRVHFVSDFNSEQTGGRPTGMDIIVGDGDIAISDTPDSKDKSIKMSQKNSGCWIFFTDSFAMNDLVMEARVRTDSMNTDKLIFMAKDVGGINMKTFILGTDGFITSQSGKSLGKYTSRTWYDLATVLHLRQQTIDYYIDGELVLKDEPFANSKYQNPSEIRIQILSGGNGDVLYMDNLKIYTGSEPRDIVLEDTNTLKTVDTNSSIFTEKVEDGTSLKGAVALVAGINSAYNGNERVHTDAPPFISNDRMYVPVRFITESFGGSVAWDEINQTAIIECEGNKIEFTLGSNVMVKNGQKITIDTVPMLSNQRIFVPLRAFAEQALSKNVAWYDEQKLAIIGTPASLGASPIKIADYIMYERPTKEAIAEAMVANHPRLMLNQAKLDKIKADTSEYTQKWKLAVINQADEYTKKSPPIYEKADGLRILPVSRDVLERSLNLSMAYHITEDEKYKTTLWDVLYSAGNFSDWNDRSHFLDTAEMTAAFAIGYDWMYNVWNDEQRQFLRMSILEKGLKPGAECLNGVRAKSIVSSSTAWPIMYGSNWIVVCGGGMSMGALAIMEDDPDLASFVVAQTLRSLELLLPYFAPDGGWEEGPGYWHYTVKYLSFLMKSLETALGTDYGYPFVNGVSKTAYFPTYISSSNGSFNFGDNSAVLINAPETFYYADIMNDGNLAKVRLEQMDMYNWKGSVYDLVYFNPSKIAPEIDLTLDAKIGKVEVASFRSSWTDKNAIFASIRGGWNNNAHGNLDSGTFVLDALGERWAVDLGSENYNLSNYWKVYGGRCDYYRIRAEGQNTVNVNPIAEYDQIIDSFSPIVNFVSKDKGGYAVVDMKSALGDDNVTYAIRGMKMNDNRTSVVVQDEITFKKPSEFHWYMHTRADIKLSDDASSAVLTMNGKKLFVSLDSNNVKAKFTVEEALPLPTSPQVNQSSNPGIRKLAINLYNVSGPLDISVYFEPMMLDSLEMYSGKKMQKINEWNVGDGEIDLPQLSQVYVDDKPINGFKPETHSYTVILAGDTESKPVITASGDGDVEIIKGEEFDSDTIKISKNGTSSYYVITYKIMPKIYVPDGMKHLPVADISASEEPQTENGRYNVIDGNFDTRWSTNGIQNITLDLGEITTIDQLGIAFMSGDVRTSYYKISVSEDNVVYTQIADKESSGKTLDFEFTDMNGIKGRFVRIDVTGTSEGSWSSITELAVYQKK